MRNIEEIGEGKIVYPVSTIAFEFRSQRGLKRMRRCDDGSRAHLMCCCERPLECAEFRCKIGIKDV